MEKITRIVGSAFPKKRELTQEKVGRYENEYLEYAERLWKRVYASTAHPQVTYEKMLTPFEYYLRERILIEDMEKKNGK